MHLLGIRLECQVAIDGVGKVDFVVDGWLIIEADGKENHATSERRHKDLVRDAAASRLGYETLRFDYAQIIHEWQTVRQAILAALRRSRARH
jgi:very-short-patch-repair endonuclease